MKTVLITGVGTGIGKETCIKFLNEGYRVVGILRNEAHLDSLLKDISNLAPNFEVIYANLESHNFVSLISSRLTQLKIDELAAIINVAGVLNTDTHKEYSLDSIEKVMRINFSNPTMLITKLYPLLLIGKGNVLNITSMSGFQGSVRFPGLGVYGASKAALSSISESLACEFEVHINALAIGSVNTQMLQKAFPEFQASISPSQMAGYIFNFATHGYQFHNGKTIPVAITNP